MGHKNFKYILVLLTVVVLGACNHLPKGILDEDKTAAILADIKLAESGHWSNNPASNSTMQLNQTAQTQPEAPIPTSNPNQEGYNDYAFIAKKHKTTVKEFQNTMDYYYKYPKRLEKILNKAMLIIQKNDAEHRRLK